MSEITTVNGPGRYQIRVKGHLDSRWATWFDGLNVRTDLDGTTTIHSPVADQSALHGLLRKVGDVGLPLISVTRLDSDDTAPNPAAEQVFPGPEPDNPPIQHSSTQQYPIPPAQSVKGEQNDDNRNNNDLR